MSNDVAERLVRLEESIGRLRGVRRARADAGPGGPSVRALIVPEADEGAISESIGGLAVAAGVDLAPGAIEILRADVPSATGRRRRRLASLSISRSDDGFNATVSLELDGDVLRGEIEGPAGRRFELRAVALAVLEGLGDLLDFEVQLDSVTVLQVGEARLAVVQLNTEGDPLVGSAHVRYDEHDAVARATLSATNRLVAHRAAVEERVSAPVA